MVNKSSMMGRRTFVGAAALASAAVIAQPLTSGTAFAVTSAEKKAEAQAALKKLNVLQEKLGIAEADYETAVGDQQAAQNNMNKAQKKIDKANHRIKDLQGQISTRVRSMYRTGSSSFLDILLGATSFQAFSTNWDLVNTMNDNDSQMVSETKELRSEVQKQKEVYKKQEKVAADKAKEAERIKNEAASLVQETKATYDSLSAEAERLLKAEQKAAEEAQRRRAQAELAAQQAAAAAAANNNSGNNSGNNNSNDNSSQYNANNNKAQTVPGGTVVGRAYAHIGKPYSWGATGPNSFDCSGFVSMCLSGKYGCRLGTTYTFMRWPRVTNPQPGDVCTNNHHCGIYIGGGQMIHAPHPGASVCVTSVHSGMIYVRY